MIKYGMQDLDTILKGWPIMQFNLAGMSSEGKKSFHIFIQVNRNLYFNIWTLKRNIKVFCISHKWKKGWTIHNSDAHAIISPLESRFGYPGHRAPDTASSKKCIFFPQRHLTIWIEQWTVLVKTNRRELSCSKLSLSWFQNKKWKLTVYTELHHLPTCNKIKSAVWSHSNSIQVI